MNKDLHNPAGVTAESLGPHHKLLSTEDLSKPLPEGAEYWCTTPDQWCPSWRMIPNPNITYRIPLTLSDRLKAEQRKHWDEKEELIRVVEAVEKGAIWQHETKEKGREDNGWYQPEDQSSKHLQSILDSSRNVRLKPTPRFIPWTLESHPDVVCLKREINGRYVHANPTHWDEHGATVSGAYYTYRELHSDWLQRNGEPCGTPA